MRPTASALERAGRCLGSALLPRVDEVTDAASHGLAIHAFLARVSEVGREQALGEVDEEFRPACAAIDLDLLPTSALEVYPELALAYDPETGIARELGRNLGRRYPPVHPREFVGTADVVTVSRDEVVVADFKTGRGLLTPAKDNPQLKFLGLAAARLLGRRQLRVALIRIAEDGTPFFDSADFDAVELDSIEEELRDLARRLDQAKDLLALGEPPPVTTGIHCRRCPSLVYCPGQAALVKKLGGHPEAVAEEILAALTPEQAATAWACLKVAEEVLRRAREALHAYARDNGIVLANGVVVGEVETQRRQLDGKIAFEVLERIHGPDVARAAVELDASQASIERALRGVAEATGEKLAKLKRVAMAELEQAGAVSLRTSRTIREHIAEKEGGAGKAA